MTDHALTVGCFEYDTTRALFDGSVLRRHHLATTP